MMLDRHCYGFPFKQREIYHVFLCVSVFVRVLCVCGGVQSTTRNKQFSIDSIFVSLYRTTNKNSRIWMSDCAFWIEDLIIKTIKRKFVFCWSGAIHITNNLLCFYAPSQMAWSAIFIQLI